MATCLINNYLMHRFIEEEKKQVESSSSSNSSSSNSSSSESQKSEEVELIIDLGETEESKTDKEAEMMKTILTEYLPQIEKAADEGDFSDEMIGKMALINNIIVQAAKEKDKKWYFPVGVLPELKFSNQTKPDQYMYQGSDIMSQLGIFSLNEFIKLRDSTVNCQKEIQEAVEELERLTQQCQKANESIESRSNNNEVDVSMEEKSEENQVNLLQFTEEELRRVQFEFGQQIYGPMMAAVE